MFNNKFRSIFSCSIIKVIIEDPSCTGSSESIQVFRQFNYLSLQSSLYKAYKIKVLDSLVVAVVSYSGIIIVACLCTFYILSMSRLKSGDQNCTAYLRGGRTKDLNNGKIRSLFLYL